MADRPAQPAVLFEVTRRMRHHAKDIGVAIFAENFLGAFVRLRRIAIIDAGHGSPREYRLGVSSRTAVAGVFRKRHPPDDSRSRASPADPKTVSAPKIPQLPHKPATGGPKCRRIAKRFCDCRYSLSGDSIKANTRRGVFRVKTVQLLGLRGQR